MIDEFWPCFDKAEVSRHCDGEDSRHKLFDTEFRYPAFLRLKALSSSARVTGSNRVSLSSAFRRAMPDG